jgi:hypothetical protein
MKYGIYPMKNSEIFCLTCDIKKVADLKRKISNRLKLLPPTAVSPDWGIWLESVRWSAPEFSDNRKKILI